MRIEDLPFQDTALGRRVTAVVSTISSAAKVAKDAAALWNAARSGRLGSSSWTEADAQALVGRIVQEGLRARNAAPERNLGRWQPFDAFHREATQLSVEMRKPESRYAKVTSGAGIQPYAWGATQLAEITMPFIAQGQRRATSTGWVDLKIDLDTRFCRDDPHVRGLDNVRRSAVYIAPFRVTPRSADPLSILVANAVRASLEKLTNFRSAMGELQSHAMAGFSCAELVWRPGVKLRIPAGNRVVTVESEVVTCLEPVSQRNFAFDIVTDEPWLCMGPGEYVRVVEPSLQKFLYIRGDGPSTHFARFRGWGWANAWLSYLAALPIEKLGILVETFGVATPYLQRNDRGIVTDDEAQRALRLLESLGTGKPGVIPGHLGELKHSPVPTNLAPLHAQMIGIVRTEQSKNMLSSTLQIEIGGVGSRAAAEVHENQQVRIEKVDATVTGEALHSQLCAWLCEVNAEAWAAAFAALIPGGCTPDEIKAEVPFCEFVITDESPTQRSAVFAQVKALGFSLDEAQVREETRVRAPLPPLTLAEPPVRPPVQPPPQPRPEPVPPTDPTPKESQ